MAAFLGNDGGERAEILLRQALDLTPDEDEGAVAAALSLDRETYRRLAEALDAGADGDRKRAAEILAAIADAKSDLRDLRSFLLTKEDEPKKLSSMATKTAVNKSGWVVAFLDAEQQRLTAGLGKLADLASIRATSALLVLAAAVLENFESEKRRRGTYDFDDLIFHANKLLSERPDAAWVLYRLDGGIDHVLVDEAQDTSPAQWRIVIALTEEFFAGEGRPRQAPRTVFAVGDRKQSIFSFQGADPDRFDQVHDEFARHIRNAGQPFHDENFTLSYRSAPAVLDAVDAVFAAGTPARRGLDGVAGIDLKHWPKRKNVPGTVELWPLMEPDAAGDNDPWEAPVDREPANSPRRKLARAIADKVRSWIGRRRHLSEARPIRAGDILILVRVRNGFFAALIRELRQRGVPVAGADRLMLADNIAVLDLLALARFCLLADDDYSLACLLKSPLVSTPLDEDALFRLAWNRGGTSLWDRLVASAEAPCEAVAHELAVQRATARQTRPYEFLARIVGERRKAILARLGSEAGDALDAFLEAALAYEAAHSSSLQGFLDWFTAAPTEIKRNMEQSADEVRIMTVHGAKGLEAPIVILPDTVGLPDASKDTRLLLVELAEGGRLPLWRLPNSFESQAMRGLKADRGESRLAEYRRLLYVAMTRAEDELYLGGYQIRGRADPGCWYNLVKEPLEKTMQPIDGGGFRLGADPVTDSAEGPVPLQPVTPPAWASAPAPAEVPQPPTVAPSRLLADAVAIAAAPEVERGLLTHRMLQAASEAAPAARAGLLRRMARKSPDGGEIVAEVEALLASPALAGLWQADGLSEVPILAGEPGGGRISGRIDRLILGADDILAVDYKTDRSVPDAAATVKPEYLAQMAAYRTALRAIHPGATVRCAILWTATASLMHLQDVVLDEVQHHNPVEVP
ncbi:MAG: UvrD-helicase domain-containing protein [Rhizobiales bacterium]|nr:UvrD-helicase domain-containing protein [Hyphomicrobiales bacterium]